MQDIKEVQVFVSCPGDVTIEKDMIKKVCDSINQTLLKTGSPVRFKVLDWRDIVGSLSGRAQEEINTVFSSYDIYIGILWMRFGTPSGAADPITSEDYQSGTEEEFRIAQLKYENGESINMYLFFKSPRAVAGKTEHDQYGKVLDFHEKVRHLGWNNSFPNKTESIEFNNQIHQIFDEWARTVEKGLLKETKEEYLKEQSLENQKPLFTEVAKFVTKAPKLEPSIPRSIIPYNSDRNEVQFYFQERHIELLTDIVITEKRIVILGNAGSGKSTELGHLAHFYANEESIYIPIYQRLNTYVDEVIDDFLPSGWKEVPEANALIILDGLDEIQPQHFNTAVRKLLTFSNQHPDLRIVVSCRTNFYDFPDNIPGGTLADFKIYFIKDIAGNNLWEFAQTHYQVNAEEFIRAAHVEGYSELTRQPFFLKLLLKEFQVNKNLHLDRAVLMNKFIGERIEFDQEHFKLTTNLKDKKSQILSLLQRVALAMEYLGRNFLFYDELLKVIPSPDDIQLVKFSTAFKNIEEDTQKWGFEHNNIQEFLAANALRDLEVEKIKLFLSFNNKKIKPSWVNTLFFLMSIIGDEKRQKLIEWILEIEPEILVKIEPDKIDDAVRFDIFGRIFNYYKEQMVWLRSNKFSERELALFAPVNQAFPFLLKELEDIANIRVTRLNAMTLIKYLPLNPNQKEIARASIEVYIRANPSDQHLFNSAIFALVALDAADEAMVKTLMEEFGDRSNQYIRSGLYQLIVKSDMVNEYIDYFIQGVSGGLIKSERDDVHLMDEDIFLKEGLSKADSIEAITKLLDLFKDPFNRKLMDFYDKNEVVQKIIANAVNLYQTHPEISNKVYEVFLGYGKVTEEIQAEIIGSFFVSTGQQIETFKKLFYDNTISAFEKIILEKPLINKAVIDFVMGEYIAHNITNSILLEFYNNIYWLKQRFNKDTEIDYLTEQLKKKTTIIADQNLIDYQKLRKDREQESFNLYFSEDIFKAEISEFFHQIRKDEIDRDELWSYSPHDLGKAIFVKESVFNYLSDFTRGNQPVSLSAALQWLEHPDKDRYYFSKIKDWLTNHPYLEVSDEQIALINQWVQKTAAKTDIAGAIKIDADNPYRTTRNNATIIIWYFVKKFGFEIDVEKMLDFTLFDEFLHNDDRGIDFGIIEGQVGKNKVATRVLTNLKEGIAYGDSWRNNANYALDNQLMETYPVILKNIGDPNKPYHSRLKILSLYIKQTGDYRGPMELLTDIGMDEIQWGVVDNIKLDASIKDDLIAYLEKILNSETASITQKTKAAQYLTEKNVENGTFYYLNYLLTEVTPAFDFYREAIYIKTIRDAKYVPKLIELLVMANRPEFKQDDFNRFDGTVSDALYNIGLQSEQNLVIVKNEIKKFIADNTGKIEHVNFYHPMIDRMEYQFYLSQSQSGNIESAVEEIKKIEN